MFIQYKYLKYLKLITLSFMFLCINLVCFDYSYLGEIALKSEDQLESSFSEEPITQKEKTNNLLQRNIPTLTRVEKQRICFEQFGLNLKNLEQEANLVDKNPLMIESLDELNILCGDSRDLKNNLRMIVDRTLTTFGSISFANIISNPTSNKSTLKNRQNFIRTLLTDQDLYDNINERLLSIQRCENNLFSLWSIKNPLNSIYAQNSLYVKTKQLDFLNKSPKFLEFSRIMQLTHLVSPIASLGQVIYGHYFMKNPMLKDNLIIGGILGFLIESISYPIRYKNISRIQSLMLLTQKIMIDLSNSTKCLKDISNLTRDYNLIYSNQLTDFIKKRYASDELRGLLKLLKSNTFKDKASIFSLLGRSLVAYRCASQIKTEFLPALQALGEIDALFSIAKLIKEYKDKKVNYCLVNFINSDTPVLNFKKGWNPLVDSDLAISEDMNFGLNNIPNLLLSGPHGSGKSCFMRGCMYMAILAQTFGIAPASECNITIFHKLSTYLNIKEDYSQNLSTFMAERKRVDAIKDIINNLNKGELSFVIMDEVFKGTMEQEGAKRVYNLGKEISANPQSLCLMATHFNYPTLLEEDTKGRFANYHVGLKEYEDGCFEKLFKLIPGKNQWWFDDSDKRDRFIEWLQSKPC